MKLSELKEYLSNAETVNFQLPNGTFVPEHFHVTEVGVITKHFIDCGGKVRNEKVANFQLWNANDYDHRLKPEKLMKIIALSEKVLGLEDLEIEVEYQGESGVSPTPLNSDHSSWQTIGKYGLAYDSKNFLLTSKHTNCLAKDNCGVEPKQKVSLSELGTKGEACCAPGGKCC